MLSFSRAIWRSHSVLFIGSIVMPHTLHPEFLNNFAIYPFHSLPPATLTSCSIHHVINSSIAPKSIRHDRPILILASTPVAKSRYTSERPKPGTQRPCWRITVPVEMRCAAERDRPQGIAPIMLRIRFPGQSVHSRGDPLWSPWYCGRPGWVHVPRCACSFIRQQTPSRVVQLMLILLKYKSQRMTLLYMILSKKYNKAIS